MQSLIVIAYAVSTSLALIFLKLGSASGALIAYTNSKIHYNLGFYTISGMALYATSFLIYTYLVARYDLGYILPLLTALVYVLIFFASFIIFKESFTTIKLVGISLILIGIVLLNIGVSK